MAFIKYLQKQYLEKIIALIWDGASYNKSDEVKEFLAAANKNYEPGRGKLLGFYFHPMRQNKIPPKIFGYKPKTL